MGAIRLQQLCSLVTEDASFVVRSFDLASVSCCHDTLVEAARLPSSELLLVPGETDNTTKLFKLHYFSCTCAKYCLHQGSSG